MSSLISGGLLCLMEWVLYLVALLSHNSLELLMWNFGAGGGLYFGWESASVVTLLYLLMVFRHRQNLQRLAKGEEAPLTWPSK